MQSSSYTEEKVPLSPTESEKLREKINPFAIFLVFIIIFLVVVFQFLPNEKIVISFFAVFGTFILGVMTWMIMSYVLDLKSDTKIIIKGRVDDRQSNVFKGGRQGQCYLFFGEKKIGVELHHYGMVRTGDLIELHYAPRSSTSFRVVRLQTENIEQSIPTNSSLSESHADFTETKPVLDRLNENDKKVLWNMYKKNTRFLFVAFIFSTWIGLGLYYGGMAALLIFLFPIPVLFIFSIIKIMIKTSSYFNEKNNSSKFTYKTILKDKHEISRRSLPHYYIKTSSKDFLVNKSLYKSAVTNEIITIHISEKSTSLLCIIRPNGEVLMND